MKTYQPRPIQSHGIRQHSDWQLKLYSIVYEHGIALDWPQYEPGVTLALTVLPNPAVRPERPGVGFLIAHQGNTMAYLILGWWDQENELPTRIFTRAESPSADWREADANNSFCVWDMQVMWFEREAYVACVLNGDGADGIDNYLAECLTVAA